METVDVKTLHRLMQGMTTKDRQLQRQIADTFLTDDVRLVHFLADVRGREAYYGVYRAAVTGIDYKLKFIETVISEEVAAVWVDLNLKLAPLYIKCYHAPTVVMLRFRRCEDGLVRICEQVDHHSLFVFMWALGWPFSSISDAVMRPLQGLLLSRSGWLVDAADDAMFASWAAARDSVAWLLANSLPASLVNTLLPAWLLQALGLTDKSRHQQSMATAYSCGQATPPHAAKAAAAAAGQEHRRAAVAPGSVTPDQDGLPEAAAAAEPATNGHQPVAIAARAADAEMAAAHKPDVRGAAEQNAAAAMTAVEGTAGIVAAAAELVAEAAVAGGPHSTASGANGARGRQQYWSVT